MLLVIATDCHHPRLSGTVTAVSDSLFVRTRRPRQSEIAGNAPVVLHRASSSLVPRAPAATTTPRAVRVLESLRTEAPVRSLVMT
jgi:hypothetical protein